MELCTGIFLPTFCPGAPTGNFKVIVNKEEIVYFDHVDPPQIKERYNHVERKYTMLPTTTLTVDVKPDTKSVELKVGKAVREAIAGPPGS